MKKIPLLLLVSWFFGSVLVPAQAFAQQPGAREVVVAPVPGVVAGGAQWAPIWHGTPPADGIVGAPDGGLLFAQEELNRVMKLDTEDQASVYLRDTHGTGALSIDAEGRILAVQRAVPRAVAFLTPERKVLADTFQGAPVSDLGRLSDLTADLRGGAYFTVSGRAYYASAGGQVTSLGESVGANGIILSPDERTLYTTNGESLLAFDILPDGGVTNQRDFARLEAGGRGDGMTIDAVGRVYVASSPGVQVFTHEGEYLGVIPTPREVTSVAFSGPDKKTLYITGRGALDADGDEVMDRGARTIYKIRMLAEGYKGRAK